jgi:protein TonB
MFDRILLRDLPRRTARRGAYSLAASALQATLFTSVLIGSAHLAAREPPPLPIVEVQIVRAAPRRAYVPPAAPVVLSAARRAALAARPGVRTYKPPPPSALVQPRLLASEMRMPAADEPIEEIDPSALSGDGDGVVGGFAGVVPASYDEAPARTDGGVEEAPRWVTTGFRKPAEEVPGCVASSIRLPPDLAGFVSERLTVKFAVGRDGSVGRVELLGDLPDRRIEAAILRALGACRWRPGADARGEPIALWVILPIRFEQQ